MSAALTAFFFCLVPRSTTSGFASFFDLDFLPLGASSSSSASSHSSSSLSDLNSSSAGSLASSSSPSSSLESSSSNSPAPSSVRLSLPLLASVNFSPFFCRRALYMSHMSSTSLSNLRSSSSVSESASESSSGSSSLSRAASMPGVGALETTSSAPLVLMRASENKSISCSTIASPLLANPLATRRRSLALILALFFLSRLAWASIEFFNSLISSKS
mmetsp:Transcript_8568/g.33965  ORF Transcript_8568/g.33965 Transcript_8568/m.33965 type:complete len:217 (+) Transcript_8568:1055-1705(+)